MEERLKQLIGNLVMQTVALQTQVDELQAKLAKYENKDIEKPPL